MWDFFNNFSALVPTWDLVILLVFLVGVFIFGVVLGRDKIISILMAVYIAFGVMTAIPSEWLDKFLSVDNWLFQLIIFVVILLVVCVVLISSSTVRAGGPKNIILKWLQAVVFALLSVGLVASIVLSILPANYLDKLTQVAKGIFMSEAARLVWFVAPVVVMGVTRRKRRGPGRPAG